MVTVTQPEVTEATVPIAGHLKIPYIWMQPGSESTPAFNHLSGTVDKNDLFDEILPLPFHSFGLVRSWPPAARAKTLAPSARARLFGWLLFGVQILIFVLWCICFSHNSLLHERLKF